MTRTAPFRRDETSPRHKTERYKNNQTRHIHPSRARRGRRHHERGDRGGGGRGDRGGGRRRLLLPRHGGSRGGRRAATLSSSSSSSSSDAAAAAARAVGGVPTVAHRAPSDRAPRARARARGRPALVCGDAWLASFLPRTFWHVRRRLLAARSSWIKRPRNRRRRSPTPSPHAARDSPPSTSPHLSTDDSLIELFRPNASRWLELDSNHVM